MSGTSSGDGGPVTVVHIFGGNLKLCSADCGPSLSEEELTESARLGLAERFGDRVKVLYHSLRDPTVMQEHEELLAKARELGVPLPLVVVDDSILQGGGIDFRAIVNAIEVKFEIAE